MKKLFVLFALMAGCFAFAACSDDSNDDPKPEEPGTEQPGEELPEYWTITIDVQNIIRSDVSESADLAECNKCKFEFNAEAVIDSVDWGTGNGWESAQEYCERYNDCVTLSSDTYPRTDPDKVYSVKIKGHEELNSIESEDNMLIVNCNFGDYAQNMKHISFEPAAISSFNLDKYPVLEYLRLWGSSSREAQLEFTGSNQSLKEFILNGYFIDELDLSNCTSLTESDLHIHINTLNLSNCTNLTVFWSHIFANTINASNCTSLETFFIRFTGGSECQNLNLSGCSALNSLVISGETVSSLDLSNCIALEEFNGSDCSLNEINLSGCTALKDLDLRFNELTELDLSDCSTVLEYLSLYGNNLSELDLSNCTALKTLGCSKNNLTELDLSNCISLQDLQCYDNKFTTSAMNKIFTDLPVVENGSLWCNNIGDLSIAEEKGWYVTIR